jgi:hypothetical protein
MKENEVLMILLYGWELSMHPLKNFKFFKFSLSFQSLKSIGFAVSFIAWYTCH